MNGLIEKARIQYNKGEITFLELSEIFDTNATIDENCAMLDTPVFDRPNFIIGKSQEQMDVEWNSIITND